MPRRVITVGGGGGGAPDPTIRPLASGSNIGAALLRLVNQRKQAEDALAERQREFDLSRKDEERDLVQTGEGLKALFTDLDNAQAAPGSLTNQFVPSSGIDQSSVKQGLKTDDDDAFFLDKDKIDTNDDMYKHAEHLMRLFEGPAVGPTRDPDMMFETPPEDVGKNEDGSDPADTEVGIDLPDPAKQLKKDQAEVITDTNEEGIAVGERPGGGIEGSFSLGIGFKQKHLELPELAGNEQGGPVFVAPKTLEMPESRRKKFLTIARDMDPRTLGLLSKNAGFLNVMNAAIGGDSVEESIFKQTTSAMLQSVMIPKNHMAIWEDATGSPFLINYNTGKMHKVTGDAAGILKGIGSKWSTSDLKNYIVTVGMTPEEFQKTQSNPFLKAEFGKNFGAWLDRRLRKQQDASVQLLNSMFNQDGYKVYQGAKRAISNILSISGDDNIDHTLGDDALVTMLAKMFDPESIVHPGEKTGLIAGRSLAKKTWAEIRQTIKDGNLLPEERYDLTEIALRFYVNTVTNEMSPIFESYKDVMEKHGVSFGATVANDLKWAQEKRLDLLRGKNILPPFASIKGTR